MILFSIAWESLNPQTTWAFGTHLAISFGIMPTFRLRIEKYFI